MSSSFLTVSQREESAPGQRGNPYTPWCCPPTEMRLNTFTVGQRCTRARLGGEGGGGIKADGRKEGGRQGEEGEREGEGHTLTHKNWPPCEKPMTLNPSLSVASAVRFAHTSVIWSLAFLKKPFSVSSLTLSPI